MTTKRKRKYAQDFSGGSLTDQSFAASCNVNNIVRHYEKTGIDPYSDRLQNQIFGVATSTSYEEAMRHAAEVNSAFALLPSAERAKHDNNPQQWLDHAVEPEAVYEPPEPSNDPPAKPAPQDASGGDQGD